VRLIHDRSHSRQPNSQNLSIPRFRVLKPGIYSRVAVAASATAPGWTRAGRLDLIAQVDSSRLEVIAHQISVPLNQEPILIELPGGQEVRYFAFEAWRSRRAGFARLRLKIWAEDYSPGGQND
jgi:hypothetical protein